MHAALVRAVLHVRTLFEKMRARVDLQIARYYIVLQYTCSRMSQPPWSNFRGGGLAPPAPRGSYAPLQHELVAVAMHGVTTEKRHIHVPKKQNSNYMYINGNTLIIVTEMPVVE